MVHHKGRGRENKTSAVHIDHGYNASHPIRIPVFRRGRRRFDRPIRVGLGLLGHPFSFLHGAVDIYRLLRQRT